MFCFRLNFFIYLFYKILSLNWLCYLYDNRIIHGDLQHFGAYLPFGVGFKWQMAPRVSLNVEWQHELFFCDNVEGIEELDNTVGLNKSNFLRNDLVSTLKVGIGFHFLREKPICRRCDW